MAFTASDWGQGRLLTGLTPGSSLSGFTAVITKDNLPTSALDAGSLSCLNGGGDWRFSTDINGATQLPCEIVTCVTNVTPSSTEFVAWVRFPTYASGTREVYAFWNRAGQSQPAVGAVFGRNAAWVDNERRYHFEEDPSVSDMVDASGNVDGVRVGAFVSGDKVAGAIGSALKFTLDTNYLTSGAVSPPANQPKTVSYITRFQTLSSQKGLFALAESATSSVPSVLLTMRSSSVDTLDSGSYKNVFVPSLLTNYKIDYIYDGTTTTVYVDNVAEASYSSGDGVFSSGANLYINSGYSNQADQIISEFEYSDYAKTSDQISSEYDNQSDPATFWTEGAVFVPGGGGASAAVTIPKPVFSSAAQSIAPIFNAAVSFTVSKPVFASTAQSVAPGNNGDVSLLIAKPVFASTAQSLAPVFNADVDLTIGKPVFTSTAEAIAPIVNGSIAFAIGKPEFAATAQAIPAGAGANASIFINKPVFASTAQSIAPIITGDVAFSINGPIFSATGQALGPNTNADASITITKPQFNAAAQAIGVDNNAAVSFNIASPIFSIFAGGAVLEYYYAKGTQIVLIEKSTIIKALNKSRTLGV